MIFISICVGFLGVQVYAHLLTVFCFSYHGAVVGDTEGRDLVSLIKPYRLFFFNFLLSCATYRSEGYSFKMKRICPNGHSRITLHIVICYCLNSLINSSAVVPKSFASAERFEVLGSEAPLSHFETACLLTPRASATNS